MPVGGWARLRFPGVLGRSCRGEHAGTARWAPLGARRGGGGTAGGAEARMAGRASDRIPEEQAALRRVATVGARAAPAAEVFAAGTAEFGRLLAVDVTGLARYEPDDAITVVGTWASAGEG